MPIQQPPSPLDGMKGLREFVISPELMQRLKDSAARRVEQLKKDRQQAFAYKRVRLF